MSTKPSQNDKALVVTREVSGHQFGQRASDGYFNATAMCKAVKGKRFDNYMVRGATKDFLRRLSSNPRNQGFELVKSIRGGPVERRGIWVHPEVAIDLASWLSPEFKALVPGFVVDWFRHQGELRGALKEWISPDLQPWTLTFPPEFYSEIYRLRGWTGPVGPQRPSVIGHYTNDIVYARLTPGLLATLRIKNPRQITGERRDKHHQWLTKHEGYPRLKEHLRAVVVLMGAFDTWGEFMEALDRTLPIFTQQLSLFESQKAEATLWDGG